MKPSLYCFPVLCCAVRDVRRLPFGHGIPRSALLFYVPFFAAYFLSCHFKDWENNMREAVMSTSEVGSDRTHSHSHSHKHWHRALSQSQSL